MSQVKTVALAAALALAGAGCSPAAEDPVKEESRMIGYLDLFDTKSAILSGESAEATKEDKIKACMAEKGQKYTKSTDDGSWPEDYLQDVKDSSLPMSTFADRWGFGLAPVAAADPNSVGTKDVESLKRRAEAEAEDEDESPEYAEALYGKDTVSGCFGKHSSEVAKVDDQLAQLGRRLVQVKLEFAQDRRVISHYTEWSQCMQEKGHSVTSPLEAYLEAEKRSDSARDAKSQQDLDEAVRLERILATDTITCGETIYNLLPQELVPVWKEYAPKLRTRS